MGAKKLNGKIKHIGKVFNCRFTNDEKRTATIISNGQEYKSYLLEGGDILNNIKVGQQVDFEMRGKSAKILLNTNSNVVQMPTIDTGAAEQRQRQRQQQTPNAKAVKQQIMRNLKLYKWTFDKVATELDDYNLKTETIKEITTTLVIQSFRKFPGL